MNYYPLSKASVVVDFETATIKGQAPDKSLYFPEYLPQVDKNLLANIEYVPFDDFAFQVMKPFVGGTIGDEERASTRTNPANAATPASAAITTLIPPFTPSINA